MNTPVLSIEVYDISDRLILLHGMLSALIEKGVCALTHKRENGDIHILEIRTYPLIYGEAGEPVNYVFNAGTYSQEDVACLAKVMDGCLEKFVQRRYGPPMGVSSDD